MSADELANVEVDDDDVIDAADLPDADRGGKAMTTKNNPLPREGGAAAAAAAAAAGGKYTITHPDRLLGGVLVVV